MTNRRILVAFYIFVLCSDSAFSATQYHYDSQHRLTKVVYDNDITIVYNYDASGNRTRRVVTKITDYNADLDIDLKDFSQFATCWLESDNPECRWIDLNGDGEINLLDLLLFSQTWLESMSQ